MAERRLHGVLQRLRGLARAGCDASMDAELLGRFVAHRDAAAFETLVRRYGPMVWGVCRRVLRDANDAEDAFQATFLVLVRKAASVARPALLGNWLYGVAYRTALEARCAAARRRAKEREAGAMPRYDASQAEMWREALPLLDQELTRLPDQFRTPIVLCDLQGKSRREAARQLRLPEGTLSSRLARGRVLLAKRMSRYGLAVSGGALAAALAVDTASAGMPPLLAGATVRAALACAAGTAVSVKVAALTQGVLRTMLLTKLKIATALLLAVGLIAAGAAATALRPQQAHATEFVKLTTTKVAAFAGDKDQPAEPEKKPDAPADGDREAAVARGLRWLALHQAPDGHWSLDEFHKFAHKEPKPEGKTFEDECTGQSQTKNDVAGTAFGVLPFLGAGYTHKAPKEKTDPDYQKTVKAGLDWLLIHQDKNGGFDSTSMYANALATYAVCEAYSLTSDPALKAPAQKGLDYIAAAQDPQGGGWRYVPKMAGDLSVTGWQITALKSGQTAGLDVDKKTLRKAEDFLDSCETKTHGFSYVPAAPETPTMTAVGLLCRERLGASTRNPGFAAGVELLKASPPGKLDNVYYEYYAAQAMFNLGGDAWKSWGQGPDGKNGVRDVLLAGQGRDPKKACEDGSWAPEGLYKQSGGRVMQTSLSLLILELYDHKLPLYRTEPGEPKDKE